MAVAKESINDQAQGQGLHLHEDVYDTGPVGCIQCDFLPKSFMYWTFGSVITRIVIPMRIDFTYLGDRKLSVIAARYPRERFQDMQTARVSYKEVRC